MPQPHCSNGTISRPRSSCARSGGPSGMPSYRDVEELLRERDAEVAERSFRKVLGATHTTLPRVITVDNNAAYPPPSMRYGMTGR
jgi:hypothetical protein